MIFLQLFYFCIYFVNSIQNYVIVLNKNIIDQMYITQENYFNPDLKKELDKSKQLKNKNKQVNIKINVLQQYVASIFVGCSLPPLNQFLQLELQNQQCKLKLQPYQHQVSNENDEHYHIYFLDSGKLFLKKKQSKEFQQNTYTKNTRQIISASSLSPTKLIKQESNTRQKIIEIKQSTFFMLTAFRKNLEMEQYQVIGFQKGDYGRCQFAKIKISQKYNLSWYVSQSQKYKFLSSIFQNPQNSISEHKLKGLSRFFKYEKFRRRAIINQQGQQNTKLMILKSGQCHYSKSFSYDQKNHSNSKVIKIAVGQSRAVVGAQFVLFDFSGISKTAIIAAQGLSDFAKKNQKLNFGLHIKNKSNFTMTVATSHAQVYYIQISKFKQLCEKYVPQLPQNLRKFVQNNYITLIRTTKQKLCLELAKINRNQKNATQQKTLIQSKLKSGNFQFVNEEEENQNQSPIKVKKSQFISTDLQSQEVQKMRTKRLEKKIQLILQSNKSKLNYKKKIQQLLKQKLNSNRLTPSPVKSKENIQFEKQQQSQIVEDLQQIFMNKDNAYRSNSIQRQNQILQKKQIILKKRYASSNNILIVHQQCYDKKKNKLFRVDLMRKGALSKQEMNPSQLRCSSDLKQYSSRVKKLCVEKINKANKIKQQFMTIRSQCQNCHCYDNMDHYTSLPSQRDPKMQTMRTGLAWRPAETKNDILQQSLQKLHSRTKLVSQKTSRKYKHNFHLHAKSKNFAQRRMSAPLL